MDYDQTYNQGAEHWSFPSPTATPTSGTFNPSTTVCQTPKASAFTSHFHDAFNTPQMQGFATPGQPGHPTMTPMQRSQMAAEALRANQFLQEQQHYDRIPEQGSFIPMLNIGSLQASSAMQPLPSNAPPLNSQPAVTLPFDSSHMQTPPPTRGASTKKNDPTQPIAFGTPSTIHSRRFMSPQHQDLPHLPTTAAQHAEVQFPQMQFPNGGFPFQNFGPASAPVFPSQIPWTSPNPYQESNPLGDVFAAAMSGNMPWPSPPPPMTGNIQSINFETPAMKSFSTQEPHPRFAAPMPPTSATFQPSEMHSGSVDPSLVYSSPVRPILQPKPRAVKARTRPSQEMLRSKTTAAIDHARSETLSSVESSNSTSSRTLRRNNTTGTADLLKSQETLRGPELSLRNAASQIARAASPQKRIGSSAPGSVKKLRPRPSVILTVDEFGRARAETRQAEDSPTTAMRERYPGLYESDSSDAESEAGEEPLSCTTSFSFSRGEERSSKAARLDPPVENLTGLSIPRSSSASSSVSPSRAVLAVAAQLRRDGSVRKRTSSRSSQRRQARSTTTSFSQMPLDTDLTSDVVFGASGSNIHSATASFEQRKSSMSSIYEQSNANRSFFGEVEQERLIRCSCSVGVDNGHPLIQCLSCKKWQHRACEKLHAKVLPPKYNCTFCKTATRTRGHKGRGR